MLIAVYPSRLCHDSRLIFSERKERPVEDISER